MSDHQICGYRLSTEVLCHEPTDTGKWCAYHSQEDYLLCRGCGDAAYRECPEYVNALRCGEALCLRCSHQPTGHAPSLTPIEIARQELTEALLLSLRKAASRGLCIFTEAASKNLATMLVDDLSTHVTLKVLSGLAAPPT